MDYKSNEILINNLSIKENQKFEILNNFFNNLNENNFLILIPDIINFLNSITFSFDILIKKFDLLEKILIFIINYESEENYLLILRFLFKLIYFSNIPLIFLFENFFLIHYFFKFDKLLVLITELLYFIINNDKDTIKYLIINEKIIDILCKKFENFSNFNLIYFFNLLQLILKNSSTLILNEKIDNIFIIKKPLKILTKFLLIYPLTPIILNLFDLILSKWTFDFSEFLTNNFIKKLKILLKIQITNKYENEIFSEMIKLWNRILLLFQEDFIFSKLCLKLIINNFYNKFISYEKILFICSNFSFFKDLGLLIIEYDIFNTFFQRYNEMNYNMKENFYFLYLNLLFNNLILINKLLIQDISDSIISTNSFKLIELFLKIFINFYFEFLNILSKNDIIEILEYLLTLKIKEIYEMTIYLFEQINKLKII